HVFSQIKFSRDDIGANIISTFFIARQKQKKRMSRHVGCSRCDIDEWCPARGENYIVIQRPIPPRMVSKRETRELRRLTTKTPVIKDASFGKTDYAHRSK